MRVWVLLTVLGGLSLAVPRIARAGDGGQDPDGAAQADAGAGDSAALDAAWGGDDGSAGDAAAGDGGGDDAASDDGGATAGPTVPVACNGGLCDTTNGSEAGGSCGVATEPPPSRGLPIVVGIGALALACGRRSKRGSSRMPSTTERQ